MKTFFLKDGVVPDPVATRGPFIPRLIWQTTRDRGALKPEILACIDKLKNLNSGWEHHLFDDRTQRTFLEEVCSERFMKAYDRIQPAYGAARADLFRYVMVYLRGGAYFDTKSGVTRPLDEILHDDDRFIISQWDNGPGGLFPGRGKHRVIRDIPGGEYEQWFVIAQPGHPYLAKVLEDVIRNIETYSALRFGHGGRGVLSAIGPYAYTRAIRSVEEPSLHRKLCAWKEGMRYTMFDNLFAHQRLDDGHYGKRMLAPVTPKGLKGAALLRYWLSEILYLPISRLRALNYIRLDRRRSKKPGYGKVG